MFKAEIRTPEEFLLRCDFDDSDYPLINFIFNDISFRKKVIKFLLPELDKEMSREIDYSLKVTVPESFLRKVHGGRNIDRAVDSTSRPNTERLSPQIRNIIIDILHCSFQYKLKHAYLKTKVAELMIEILSLQSLGSFTQKWSEHERKSFEKVRDLLGHNMKANYSIEELAIAAGMNRTKLQHGFKDLFNKTIYNFSLDLKMNEAKALLTRENNLSLKEIALLLGYKHVNHFSVAFKKKFKISPSLYKKLLECVFPIFILFA